MAARMKSRLPSTQMALAFLFVPSWALALPDPTEPPRTRVEARAENRTESVRENASLAWVRVNGLQSVAWYGGTTVKLGDAVEGGRVVAIHEDHIVISGRDGRRIVYLLDHAARTRSQALPGPVRNNQE